MTEESRRFREGEACAVDDFGRAADAGRDHAATRESPGGGAAPLRTVLDDLLAMERELAGDVMPRAARITGTSQRLLQVRARLDAAIGTMRALLDAESREPARSSAAHEARSPGAWTAEQEGLAAVRAARSVT